MNNEQDLMKLLEEVQDIALSWEENSTKLSRIVNILNKNESLRKRREMLINIHSHPLDDY